MTFQEQIELAKILLEDLDGAKRLEKICSFISLRDSGFYQHNQDEPEIARLRRRVVETAVAKRWADKCDVRAEEYDGLAKEEEAAVDELLKLMNAAPTRPIPTPSDVEVRL